MSGTEGAGPFGGADPDTFSYVTSSVYRLESVVALRDQPMTPSEIEAETGHDISHISRGLGDLSDRGLVECIVPERHKGRYYALTDDGEQLVEQAGELIEAEARGGDDGE